MPKMHSSIRAIASCAAIAVTLFACGGPVPTQPAEQPHPVGTIDQAGSTHLSVTSIEPWDVVAPLLVPNFTITGDQALSQSIPNTADVSTAVVNALAAQFQVGARIGALSQGSDQAQSTGGLATVTPSTASALAGLLPARPGLGQDPVLLHLNANALFQEVVLLNREVQAAARRFGYRAYLVRLKVDLVPFARNEPYDAYSDISFFTLYEPGDENNYFASAKKYLGTTNSQVLPLPVVVPLLVTDDLVGTNSNNAGETSRQFALSLTALLHNVTANVGLQDLVDALKTITGTSLTSVENVARHTDNTLRVRMGGTLSPDIIKHNTYVIQPRSHNVTVLLLVPRDWDNKENRRFIHVVANNTFRDAETGKEVKGLTGPAISKKLVELFDADFEDWQGNLDGSQVLEQLHGISKTCPSFEAGNIAVALSSSSSQKDIKLAVAGYLYDRVVANDQSCFIKALNQLNLSLRDYEYDWIDFAALGSIYGEAEALIEVPPRHIPEAPPAQTALVIDDGKSAATAQLIGGQNLSADRVMASLTFAFDQKPLMAKSVSTTGTTGLQLTFPTLGTLCKKPAPAHAAAGTSDTGSPPPPTEVPCGKLTIWQRTDPWLDYKIVDPPTPDDAAENEGLVGTPYDVLVRTVPGGPSPFSFDVKVTEIVPDDQHNGIVRVFLGVQPTQAATVSIEASGGEITGCALAGAPPSYASCNAAGPPGLKLSNGVITLTPATSSPPGSGPTAVDIALQNLVPGQLLQLSATGTDRQKQKSQPQSRTILLMNLNSTKKFGAPY